MLVDPWTTESCGFDFVTMETVDDADRCLKYLIFWFTVYLKGVLSPWRRYTFWVKSDFGTWIFNCFNFSSNPMHGRYMDDLLFMFDSVLKFLCFFPFEVPVLAGQLREATHHQTLKWQLNKQIKYNSIRSLGLYGLHFPLFSRTYILLFISLNINGS